MLPEGYPHKEKLEGAGYNRRQKVRSQLAAEGGGQLKTTLDATAIEEVRQYEAAHPEEQSSTPPPTAPPVPTRDSIAPPTTQPLQQQGEKPKGDTEEVTLAEARMYKGALYGPGTVPVPKGLADSLRRKKVLPTEGGEQEQT